MRELADETSKVVSDAVYSEEVTILQRSNRWVQIRTTADQYSGWVEGTAVAQQEKDFFQGETIAKVKQMQAHVYSVADTEFGPLGTLPFGSRLKILEEQQGQRWIKVALVDGKEAFIQRGDITKDTSPLSKKEMVALSHDFLKVPYAWGGRSSLGFDCSGFTQTLYKEMGVNLPRDSKDQLSWQGFKSVEIDEIESGDLIFFGTAQDKIRHVGMALNSEKFIHAVVREQKPNVHISSLKDPDWNGSEDASPALTFRAARRLKPPVSTEAPKSVVAKSSIFIAVACLIGSVAFRLLKRGT